MDDSELPTRAVDYTNDGAGARVGFLSQQDSTYRHPAREGPCKVILSVDAAEAEATEAFKEIQIATPGSDSEHNNAMRSIKDGVDNGKKKYSGKAAKDS